MLKNPLKTLLDALINHFTKEHLVTLILQHDEKLLTFMLEHENANDYKNAFFKMIANSLVFNEKALLECLEIKELENSFTRFKNKIGLYSQGGLIKSSELVVLNFPFKDNVLLGNAKDNSAKTKELFYHEILHKKEIDTLLSPKVLCHFEMHGEGDLESALKDKNTNYLIKGNNLIALHSLKKKFAKQVKCIYIDPPYNTGNDSFNYNDNFNHSSWLVFMKNRLEAAREFLSDDGSIYINLDYNEVHYCKVLMDEIFKRENFRSEIIWRMGFLSGYKTAAKKYIRNHDTILFYSKSDNYLFNKTYIENKDFLQLLTKNEVQNAFKKFSFPQEKVDDFLTFINHENRGEKYPLEDTWNSNKWDKLNSIAIDSSVSRVDETIVIDDENFKGQKPESLIQRILEVSTNENDLVLDFFAGSGTTCAVAHKMKRRYIGIEQMDYIETITKERLKKVIEGEQGGISKKCGFKGGGSFVYAELKEVNLEIKKQILNANSASECLKIFNDLNERFLKRTDCKIDEIHSEEFHNLDLNEQKRIYCALLDSNEDYLNLGDMDEDAWGIDKITKKYNEIFYS
ncbi:site-specific DNA-methyltransferase [Helicobacter pylori]|uniref:site-specific DNA-methyltransferase (adenine-specific) n=1 Tax=Helicobacter pylori TaxID=210 RepID=A0AAE7DV34_HELPX|nr:site-specific DNA-methyltransferase [Helicobacter pylori]QJW29995.1 site-specific DNA-methyltransferase [Helicobacter pylori A45]QJW41283.1 site-specific DNA-methyltransferase [Helicobacter pylori]QJW42744.1 site-specific DNA-methyltransferase [Helicobacter pylori]QJW44202.1 site-specific DNA-methyltransferase [Helicobacter pylori]